MLAITEVLFLTLPFIFGAFKQQPRHLGSHRFRSASRRSSTCRSPRVTTTTADDDERIFCVHVASRVVRIARRRRLLREVRLEGASSVEGILGEHLVASLSLTRILMKMHGSTRRRADAAAASLAVGYDSCAAGSYSCLVVRLCTHWRCAAMGPRFLRLFGAADF